MSKLDAQRAMREAKYAARTTAAAPRRARATPPVAPPADTSAAARGKGRPASTEAAAPAPSETLCGHRSMNGRTCVRAAGHAEKSHRYG